MSKEGTKTIENDVNSVFQLVNIDPHRGILHELTRVKAANNVHNIIKD